MKAGWLRRPKSLFTHTLMLVTGVALAMAALNIGIIVLRPPPRHSALSSYEVSRLMRGQPIASDTQDLRINIETAPPRPQQMTPYEALVARAVAGYLHVAPERVRIRGSDLGPRGHEGRHSAMVVLRREFDLYGSDNQFNPHLFGFFSAAVELPDGRWKVVHQAGREPLDRWEAMTIFWILASLLVLLPFAWLFSRRMARPFSQFAAAANSLGRGGTGQPVEVKGPAEVRVAAQAMNNMQTRIHRYLTERTSVVGAIAHDLRTPLSRLAFLLASAPEGIRSKSEAEIAEMEHMITSTLDFVQSEARVHPKERLDLTLLVEGVADDLSDLGRDVRMDAGEPITILGDAVLLKRVFANLLTNAVTYGQRAYVSVRSAGDQAIVEISDEGPGISTADLERVFEPFYRTEGSRNRSTGGIGLGLAIVQAAVTAHNGKVMLQNREGGGLTATVTLPIDTESV